MWGMPEYEPGSKAKAELVVPERKVTDYLLNVSHSSGAPKAVFFIRKGFTPDDPNQFSEAIMDHYRNSPQHEIVSGPYGVRVIVSGPMQFPNGDTADIRAVWMIELGSEVIKLVTAYRI